MRQHICGGECQEPYESCDEGEQKPGIFGENEAYLDINDDVVNHDEMSKVGMPVLACMRKEIKAIIELWRRPDIASRQERLRSYPKTLLHEMIHAFLKIYTCLCFKCYHNIPRTIGHTGYGMP
ncbi:6421420b-aff3-4a9e-8d26-677ef5a655c6-CDS [Sclerotinia trifoliorum]|uniref:6421420b-aff3-4a9e-8d26-677ef5a655c6-CDS n=1 Tax=Sclerotinia trifoliorum TaxID=28548 RepID=A0A8H2ZMX3_9HELO|nr:6421420b-aff3-4a9e-8d26-677ef5a655c6-CDS [Sclerotinia trifoliorum]